MQQQVVRISLDSINSRGTPSTAGRSIKAGTPATGVAKSTAVVLRTTGPQAASCCIREASNTEKAATAGKYTTEQLHSCLQQQRSLKQQGHWNSREVCNSKEFINTCTPKTMIEKVYNYAEYAQKAFYLTLSYAQEVSIFILSIHRKPPI